MLAESGECVVQSRSLRRVHETVPDKRRMCSGAGGRIPLARGCLLGKLEYSRRSAGISCRQDCIQTSGCQSPRQDRRIVAPHWRARGVGGGSHILSEPPCPHGGIESRGWSGLLRPRVQRPAAGTLFQIGASSCRGLRRASRNPERREMVRAGAGVGAAGQPWGKNSRLHHWKRHELAGYRRRKPALSAAGKSL